MGFRISWLAVPSGDKDRLLDLLQLTGTVEPDEANEASFSVSVLPTGWAVLWSNDQGYAAHHAAAVSRTLSSVIAVEVDETCMHSTAALFDAGYPRWRVHHEGDQRIDFLEKDGSLPAGSDLIEQRAREAQQAEDRGEALVDYLFDVPLEIAQSICGFKHDRFGYDWGEPAFTIVKAHSSTGSDRRRSFWSRLIGAPR